MRKVKLLYTIPNFDTAGSGKHMVDLIRHLDSDKFDVSICCDHDGGAYFKEVQALGFSIYIRKVAPSRDNYFSGFKNVRQSVRFLKSHKFDLIHSFHWKSDWFEPLAARMANIPWLYTKKNEGWNKHWYIRQLLASYTIVLNAEMTERYPIKGKVSCIGLGPNFREIENRLKVSDQVDTNIKQRLKDKYVIGVVANLVEVKNVHLLVDAFNQFSKKVDSHIIIIGDTNNEYARRLITQCKTHLNEDNYSFTGKISNVIDHLKYVDLYVQPTSNKGRGEALGVAAIESIASKTLTIASDVSGLRFVCGDNQVLFEPDNTAILLEKMQWAYHLSTFKKEQIISSTYQRAMELFDITRVAEKHEAVYAKLIEH